MEPAADPQNPRDGVADASVGLDGLYAAVRGLDDDELTLLVAEVEGLGRRIDALRTRVAGEVAIRSARERGDRRLSARYGCRNGGELLERLTGASPANVQQRLRVDESARPRFSPTAGETVAPLAVVAAAWEAGVLGLDAVGEITKAVEAARPHADAERLQLMERHLVAIASGAAAADDVPIEMPSAWPTGTAPAVPLSVVRVQASAWLEVLTADGVEPVDRDAGRLMRTRTLSVRERPDGLFRIDGVLAPEIGAQLLQLLSAHTNPARSVRFTPTSGVGSAGSGAVGDLLEDGEGPLPGGDRTDDGQVLADDVTDDGQIPVDDRRTPGQRRHDALAAALGAAARASETPTLGGAAPTVMIHVTAEDLAAEHGIAHLDGAETAVPAAVARRIACAGDIMRVVFDEAGQIIRLDSGQRLFTAHQRKAIAARDGGCIIPGCTIPAAWCEIHHVEEHALGGPTHTSNGVLLCWWHHHHLEASGWAIRMQNGVPYVKAPHWIDRREIYRPAPASQTRMRSRLRSTVRRPRTPVRG